MHAGGNGKLLFQGKGIQEETTFDGSDNDGQLAKTIKVLGSVGPRDYAKSTGRR
jgi:hypothetical protein